MENMLRSDVVILCGGLGTRLRSVTDQQKVMADFQGRPFLDLLIEHVKKQGFDRFILLTGYKAKELESIYTENDLGAEIIFSREDEPLGTGGALKNARDKIRSEHFFVLNGDSFCSVDLQAVLEFHQAKESFLTNVLVNVDDGRDYGQVCLDEKSRIIQFVEKGKSDDANKLVNAGIYCMNQDVFDGMPESKKFSLEQDFLPNIIHVQPSFGFLADKFWDIGTPERFHQARKEIYEN